MEKKWISNTAAKSDFYLIERELWAKYAFYYFVKYTYFNSKISPISKKVKLQNCCQMDFFLPNRI